MSEAPTPAAVPQSGIDFSRLPPADAIVRVAVSGEPAAPVNIVLREDGDRTVYTVDGCDFNGVFFETPERAVQAFAKMVEYRRFLDRSPSE